MSDWWKPFGAAALLFLGLFSLIVVWDSPPAPVVPEHGASVPSNSAPLPQASAASTVAVAATAPLRFEKLDQMGEVLPDSAPDWECVRDNRHRLVWEVKQDNGALRDLDFTYTWYSAKTGVGVPDGGRCYYIYCDTERLIEAVNKEGLCGRRDWRLPTSEELMSLDTDRLYYDPDIDQRYFPHARAGYYWTSTPADVGESLVWSINFLNGFPYVTEMRLAYHVRLVREDRP